MRASNSRSLRVLIVEDSPDDAFLLLRELRKGGFEPEYLRVEATQALADALTNGGWQLVISDYNLPRFSALDVINIVHDCDPDLPVIIVSGAIGEDLAVQAMHAGAHDYIMKDNLARLNAAVARELHEMEVHRKRRKAEQALKDSEERFRELTETIQEVVWLIDCAKGRMVYISPAFEKIWHQSPQPLLERLGGFLDTVHPEDYDRIHAVLECDGWAGFNEEYRIQRPDGEERWIHTRSFPIRDGQGNVCRIAGLSTDISKRKMLEAETQKLSRALEQTADAVMITNRDGVIEYVNAAFEDLSGFARQEVLNQRPKLFRSGFQDNAFYNRIWKNLSSGLPCTDVFINRRKDGELYYEEKTITPVRDKQGEICHFVSTGRDITQRLRLQQRLHHVNNFDALTGLANRIMFLDRLTQALLNARRMSAKLGVLCVGLDFSGLVGENRKLEDSLLPLVARRLRESVPGEMTARIGRDEFAVLFKDISGPEQLEAAASAILSAFVAPLVAEGYELFLTPGIGISMFPQHGEETEELLRNAAAAMSQVRQKERDGNGYRFFSASKHAKTRNPLRS